MPERREGKGRNKENMEGRITVNLHIRSYREASLGKEVIEPNTAALEAGWDVPFGLLAGRSGVGIALQEAKAVVTQQLLRKGLWE